MTDIEKNGGFLSNLTNENDGLPQNKLVFKMSRGIINKKSAIFLS